MRVVPGMSAKAYRKGATYGTADGWCSRISSVNAAAVANPTAECRDGKERLSKFVNPVQNLNLNGSSGDTRGRARPTGPRTASLNTSVKSMLSAQWRPMSAVVGECARRPTPHVTTLAIPNGVSLIFVRLLTALRSVDDACTWSERHQLRIRWSKGITAPVTTAAPPSQRRSVFTKKVF